MDILLIALFSAVIGAVADVYAKGILDGIDTKSFVTMNFLSLAIITTVIVPFNFSFSGEGAFYILVPIFVLDWAANYLLFDALKNGEISHVSPLSSLEPLFAMVFSMAILPSFLSSKVAVAVIGIVSAVYFLNLYGGPLEPFKSLGRKHNIYAIAGAACFGLTAVLSKIAMEYHVNVYTLFWLRSIFILAMFLAVFGFRFDGKKFRGIFSRAVLVSIQWILAYTAIGAGNAVIAVAVSQTIPIFVLFMAYFMYGEKITAQKVVAVLVIVVSIIYLEI